MMSWDYRVFCEEGGYTIRTVYYDDKGAIAACSEKEVAHEGESLEELQEELNQLLAALKKQVISPAAAAPSKRSSAGKKRKILTSSAATTRLAIGNN